jgi:fatty-acyl-CoA synthase/long-chain acyl-CoA synthetase
MIQENFILSDLFSNALPRYASRIAVETGDGRISYEELLSAARTMAHAIQNVGIGSNVSVGLLMSNSVEYVISDLAVMLVGAVRVALNDMLSADDIKYILEDAQVQLLLVDRHFVDTLVALKPELPLLHTIVVTDGLAPASDGWMDWDGFRRGFADREVVNSTTGKDMAVIMYTGGTTGRPKGIIHTQEAMVLNLFSHLMELNIQDTEVMLLMTPLPHSAGFFLNAGLLKGATHLVETRFDPNRALDRLQHDGVTLTFLVPTMLYRLLDVIALRKPVPDFPHLQTIAYGAAPITVARLEEGLKCFGQVFLQIYGQSEAPNFITRLRREDHVLDSSRPEILSSCGQSVLMGEVRIADENDNLLPAREVGEIKARTPYNMFGYHRLVDKTAEVLLDGWLHTGDLGWMDEEGYVYLVDRKNDIIISGGMNVYSSEVESLLQRHEGISQVAVVGIPDPDWGETVLAVVVRSHGESVSEEELLQWAKDRLAKYKHPKVIKFVDSLPVTAYGKVDKKVLRQAYWAGEARQIH